MTFVRWVIGAFVVVPLLIGGAAGVIAGVIDASGTALVVGLIGLALGFPLMRLLQRYE